MSRSARRLAADFTHTARAVALGASAGGIEALLQLLPSLPAGWGPSLVAVLHLPEDHDSVLASVFAARCAVPVREAGDKEPIAPGTLYFAPPGYHLLVERDGSFSFSCDPPVNFSRPSIDVLLESAAIAYGESLVAVLLTGANEDGARGIEAARAAGALTVVQDPGEARNAEMPSAALARCEPDFVLPLAGIRSLLSRLEFPE